MGERIPDLSLGFCKGCGKIAGRCNCELRRQTGFADRENWLTYKPVLLLEKVRVPIAVVYGQYENLTDEELVDHQKDVTAELTRRQEAGHDLGKYESYTT